MRLLTDENIETTIVHALRESGHDVFDVKEAGWYGKSDEWIVRAAARVRRVIITHDKDFLVQLKVSVVVLHFHLEEPKLVADVLCAFLESQWVRRMKRPVRVILAEHRIEICRM